MTSFADRVRGCLVFGAVGDALGAQVELSGWPQIQERFGPRGVAGLASDSPFTDDTQMTLFTAEGLIRARVRSRAAGAAHTPSMVLRSYQRWWWTQERGAHEGERPAWVDLSGWLAHDQRLHARRGPGKTCLSALASGRHGTTRNPLNDSKGSGAVMRSAPVGLVLSGARREGFAYRTGCDVGALTHGHPDGWGSAGALTVIVARLVQGMPLAEAVARTILVAEGNTRSLMERAVALASRREVAADSLAHELGGGWTGDEALAIAVACALGFDEPSDAMLAAVNHSGDSDSTGSVCGNILGAAYGPAAIPDPWRRALRDVDLVELVAEDLVVETTNAPYEKPDGGRSLRHGVPQWWWLRYPGS